ncbi:MULTISPECIES: hypothetical protein [Streptomyces]|nr:MULTISPECIES: hypothetical protein [Streptomyces]
MELSGTVTRLRGMRGHAVRRAGDVPAGADGGRGRGAVMLV